MTVIVIDTVIIMVYCGLGLQLGYVKVRVRIDQHKLRYNNI